MKQIIIPVILLTYLFFGCTSVPDDPTDFEEAPLLGMIYDGHNKGVAAAQITLDEEPVTESDINGRFVIPNLNKGTYTITIEKEGFETRVVEMEFLNRSNILYVNLLSIIDYTQEADQYILQGNFSKAWESITKGLAISPEDASLRYLFAIYYFKISEFEQSKNILEKLAEEYPFDAPIFLFLLDIAVAQPELTQEILEFISNYPAILNNERIKTRLNIIEARG